MKVLGSRGGGVITLALVAAALVAAGVFAVPQLMGRPSVQDATPAPGSAVATDRPEVSFDVAGTGRLRDLRVTLDGRDVTARLRARDGRVVLDPGRLSQGAHSVEVSFATRNVFARSVHRAWDFEVDTEPPRLAVRAPERDALIGRRAVRFAGTSDPGADVEISFRGRSLVAHADEEGAWKAVARLPEGATTASIAARDRAGNSAVASRRVVVDTVPPDLAVSAPANGAQLTETDEPLIHGRVASESPRGLAFTVAVNGRKVAALRGRDAARPGGSGVAEVASSGEARLEVDGRRFALAAGRLAQGRNRIVVSARDGAGNVTRVTRIVHINSTESFGAVDLVAGARGEDVVTLQERLRAAGVYPKKAKLTGVLDPVTRKSVVRYQRRLGLPRTGVVDARTRKVMLGRIVINLGERRLRLIRGGEVVRTYPVAVGTPQHPTPTGTYQVVEKQVDPAWFPPDSPWAAGLGPIPPGPGNPLGTRWIGTSAPAIGIHGTYASSSIGTAASHGCVRMHIPDVEELYEEVAVGMEVTFRP